MTTQYRAAQIVDAIKLLNRDDAIALMAAYLEQERLIGAKQEANEHLQSMRERHERWHDELPRVVG